MGYRDGRSGWEIGMGDRDGRSGWDIGMGDRDGISGWDIGMGDRVGYRDGISARSRDLAERGAQAWGEIGTRLG